MYGVLVDGQLVAAETSSELFTKLEDYQDRLPEVVEVIKFQKAVLASDTLNSLLKKWRMVRSGLSPRYRALLADAHAIRKVEKETEELLRNARKVPEASRVLSELLVKLQGQRSTLLDQAWGLVEQGSYKSKEEWVALCAPA